MAKKCELCNKEIKKGFMNKIKGTIIKTVDENKKSKLHYICSECQEKYQDKLKEKIK